MLFAPTIPIVMPIVVPVAVAVAGLFSVIVDPETASINVLASIPAPVTF